MRDTCIKNEKRSIETRSDMDEFVSVATSRSSSENRRQILICPICSRYELYDLSDKTLLEKIYICPSCEVPFCIFDENGKLTSVGISFAGSNEQSDY
ncbi:MAG: hypothetical protein PHY05_04385 [Methanothrix sp.]|nr:hypothetical protein [Methanothrix sp.]